MHRSRLPTKLIMNNVNILLKCNKYYGMDNVLYDPPMLIYKVYGRYSFLY